MTYNAVPLVPRSVLFGNPTYAAPTISPDGTRLAYLAPDEGVLNVWVAPIERPDQARVVTRDRGQGIRIYGFCHDDKTLYYLQDSDGDENWRLHLLHLDSGADRCVTPFEECQVQILGHNRWHPEAMVLGLNKDNVELHDVYRLDLTNGELTKQVENPGYAGWLVDTDYRVRGAMSVTSDGGAQILLASDPNDPQTLAVWREIPPEDLTTTDPIGFSRDGRMLYLISSADANAARLVAVDLVEGTERVLAEDPDYDASGVIPDPLTREPVAVCFDKDREEWRFLDNEFAGAFARVREALARHDIDGEIGIQRTARADRSWIISIVPSDGPVHYFHYDRDADSARLLFVHRPELSDYRLAPMEPFSFTARDGVTVHGYLSVPHDVERRDLPAVLNVHGGPWARDTWGYHPEAQWLANRGYVCIQVNFRGSTGYGKAFGNAGDKQWGQAMHTDLLDAVDHLVGTGLIARTRVGVMGGSYGGYAALVAAAFTPAAFRCAIDICGPSNLLTLLESIPPYWKPVVAMMYSKVGHPEVDRDLLWDRSPLSRAADIGIPVLVVQGANDPRVKVTEAEQIVAALQANELPHEYLLFPDEGHGLVRPENQERMYSRAERFLAEHLGGRAQDDEPGGAHESGWADESGSADGLGVPGGPDESGAPGTAGGEATAPNAG